MEQIRRRLTDLSPIEEGLDALDDLRQSLVMSSDEVFWLAMRRSLSAFLQSPTKGYLESMLAYGRWYSLAPGLLKALRGAASNPSAIILVATFMASMILIKLLVPLQTWQDTSPSKLPHNALCQMRQWVYAIDQTVPDNMRKTIDWAKSIMELLPLPSTEDSETTFSPPLSLEAKIDMLQNMEKKAHMVLGDVVRLGSELTSWFEDFVYHMSSKRTSAVYGCRVRPKDSLTTRRQSALEILLPDAKGKG